MHEYISVAKKDLNSILVSGTNENIQIVKTARHVQVSLALDYPMRIRVWFEKSDII